MQETANREFTPAQRRAAEKAARIWGLVFLVALIATVVALAVLPVLVFVAIPIAVVLAVHHTRCMLRVAGSIVSYAILLGLDLLMLVLAVGTLVDHLKL